MTVSRTISITIDSIGNITSTKVLAGYDSENEATILSFTLDSSWDGYDLYIDFKDSSGTKNQSAKLTGTTYALSESLMVAGKLYCQLVGKLEAGDVVKSNIFSIFIDESLNSTDEIVAYETDILEDHETRITALEGGGSAVCTASNVGVGGVGLFKQKTGTDLEFKNINAGSNKVTVTDDTDNNEVDINIDESKIDLSNCDNTTSAFIDDSAVTYENLDANGDIGTDAGTVAAGDDSRFPTLAQKTNWDTAYNALAINADTTGFRYGDDVVINYDSTTRKVTVTGTTDAYYQGEILADMVSGWVSDAHDAIDGVYFLQYNGSAYVWSSTTDFRNMLIAWVYYSTSDKFALREAHGLMDWESHREFHKTVGTYRDSGGTLSNYTLADTADKQPYISATVVYDEDCKTTIPALSVTNAYTQYYQSGATPDHVFTTGQSSIVPVSGNQPYWNEYTGGSWQQTLMSNGYMSVWLIAVPVTADSNSQQYRYVWVQGQSNSANTLGGLLEQKGLSPNDVYIGDFESISPEFVFIAQVIINYSGGNWSIAEVVNISGTRLGQVNSPNFIYLSSVTTDTSLTGSGTASDPLSVVYQETIGLACSDETTDLITGTAKLTFRMPYAMTLTAVRANVNTAPAGSTIIVDINESGSTVLSTKLTIDAGEKTSVTAATPAVISDSSLADDAEITVDIDQVGSSTAGKGLKVLLIGTRA